MDRIEVGGIEYHGFHGCAAAEREVGHRFRVDLVLEQGTATAARTDDLTATADYAEAARVALEVGRGPSVRLVETLAERTAAALLERFPRVGAVEVCVTKLQPPAPLAFQTAAVRIRRVREV